MTTFKVTRRIYVDADTPLEAALKAHEAHREPDSNARFAIEWTTPSGRLTAWIGSLASLPEDNTQG